MKGGLESDQLLQLTDYGVYFLFRIVFAKGKANGNQVWVVVDGVNYMRTLVCSAGASATA